MRHFLTLILIFGFVSTAVAVENPGFNAWENNRPLPWDCEYVSGCHAVDETPCPYEGVYSLGLETSGEANKGVWQDVAVTPGQFYVFSAWLYSLTEAQDVGILISWYDERRANVGWTDTFYPTSVGVWEEVKVVGAKAPDEAVIARLRVRGYCNGAYCGYADATDLQPVECVDADGDGYAIDEGDCGEFDCDDTDEMIYPGALETCADEVNSNCDPNELDNDRDKDHDGYFSDDQLCGGDDCDDENWEVNPSASDPCDEVDQNCDGTDGFVENKAAGNCEDGLDNDCDGLVDTDDECQCFVSSLKW